MRNKDRGWKIAGSREQSAERKEQSEKRRQHATYRSEHWLDTFVQFVGFVDGKISSSF